MASKKDSNSVNKGKENSQDDLSLLELSNLDKKTEIVSQTSEVSKNDDDNGFAKFGFVFCSAIIFFFQPPCEAPPSGLIAGMHFFFFRFLGVFGGVLSADPPCNGVEF